MRIFLLGAAGNAGQRILRAALARGHEVTAMVRDETKLPSSPNLRATRGIVDKSPDLARVMAGHDVVIMRPATWPRLPHSPSWFRP